MNSPKTITHHSTFASDVHRGLSSTPKYLPSKYFYNAQGDALFQQIMQLPEYYLTRCEFEIFSQQKAEILRLFRQDLPAEEAFQLIEFGAGDGLKTKVLLTHFLAENMRFSYSPVDISSNVLRQLTHSLQRELPSLHVEPIEADYFAALERVRTLAPLPRTTRRIVLFLGSNLGNFAPAEADAFLRAIADRLAPGDLLCLGLDLQKDPALILNAYNDAAGVTRAFNLNLLQRINDELDGNFQLNQFAHYPTYHPITGETRSYLISQKKQRVVLGAINMSVEFDLWEPIEMELSYKYAPSEIEKMAQNSGFEEVTRLFDCKHYFTNAVWRKNA